AFEIRPRIEDSAVVADSGKSLTLIGVDMVADAAPGTTGSANLDSLAGGVWLSRDTGRKPGDTIRLIINDRLRSYRVSGILEQRPGSVEGEGVVVMDIGLAMRELSRPDRLNRILIRVPENRSLAEWEKILRRALPPSVDVEREGARTDENRRMLRAFR